VRILIVKFGALGDVVRTSYLLPGLWNSYDKPEIWWLTAEASFDLLRFNPYVSRIVTGTQSDALNDIPFDLVISLDDEVEILDRVARLTFRDLIGAYLQDGVPLYEERSAEWFDMGLISRYGKERADRLKRENSRSHSEIFADMCGIDVSSPSFFGSHCLEEKMAQRFDRDFFAVGLNSGSGSRWHSKQLAMAETVELTRGLTGMSAGGRPIRVYLLGGVDEVARHAQLLAQCDRDRVVDTGSGNSLLEFAAIIRNCDYVISSDSLALHLAIAQSRPTLSFFAPTSASEIGVFGLGVKVVSTAPDYCSYRSDADVTTITAGRIMDSFTRHVAGLPGMVNR